MQKYLSFSRVCHLLHVTVKVCRVIILRVKHLSYFGDGYLVIDGCCCCGPMAKAICQGQSLGRRKHLPERKNKEKEEESEASLSLKGLLSVI